MHASDSPVSGKGSEAVENKHTHPQSDVGEVPALTGSIELLGLEYVAQLVDYAALSGELQVWTTGNCGSFFFDEGVLLHGILSTNYRKVGRILVDIGLINEKDLQECLDLSAASNGQYRLGYYLMEKGLVTMTSLTEALNIQVKEAFFEALGWEEGGYAFFSGRVPGKEEILFGEPLDLMLDEGQAFCGQRKDL